MRLTVSQKTFGLLGCLIEPLTTSPDSSTTQGIDGPG
jgi:hypothetical protein